MKLKRIGLIALSITSLFAMAACSSNGDTTVTNNEVYPDVTLAGNTGEYKEVYSSFSINTDNVKKVFYLGDSFNADGLKVVKNYLSYDKDNNLVDIPAKQYETREYSVDSSEVNINAVGKYPVYVTCRVGTSTNTLNYEVEVRSSLFESTAGLEYISGIDVSYVDDTIVKTYTINNDGEPISLSESDLKYTVYKKKIGSDLVATSEAITPEASKLSFDFSTIDKDKLGTYMIKVTYDGGKVTVEGKEYDNKVVSYVLVHVKNDAVKISAPTKAEAGKVNKDTFKQTLDGIDLSSWKVKITREVGTEIVDFSTDLFEVSGLDNFKVDALQELTITLIENPSVKFYPNIYIEASTTLNINVYKDLTPNDGVLTGATEKSGVMSGGSYNIPTDKAVDGMYKLAGTDFIFGSASYVEATKTGIKYENRLDKSANSTTSGGKSYLTDKCDSLFFPTRLNMTGSSQKIKVVMDKPGQIAVFFAQQKDDVVELIMQDANGEELEVHDTTSYYKQEICKKIFTCEKAGTYYFVNPSGGVYFHGLAIATAK